MNINDERTASPMAGDASEWLRTQANPSAGKAPGDMRTGIGEPPWAHLRASRDELQNGATRLHSMPSGSEAEPNDVITYFRNNLPAILIVCIVAAFIGVAIGMHFADPPSDHGTEARPADTYLKHNRMSEAPVLPSDTMMLRIEEMRKIAAEDAVDTGTSLTAPAAAAPAVKRAESAAAAKPPQPQTGNSSSLPCNAASVALALCDHQ